MSAMEQVEVRKYQPYPEYKESGIEWLTEIPANWSTSKLRYMFTFGKGLTITKENLKDEGIPCINYGEVHSKYSFEVDPTQHSLKCVDDGYLKTSADAILHAGDFVFADTSEDIDGSGNFTQLRSDVVTFAGYHTIIVRPADKKNHRFFAYLFDSKEFRTQIRHAVKGVKVFSITQAILRGADIWLPPHNERQRIAAFLDYETGRIDRLIAKQQRLIELLKEKRQAVISHAVTKGLNPDTPMKDSGVEWLGLIPSHWNTISSRRIFSQRNVKMRNGDRQLASTQKYGVIFQDEFMNLEGRRVMQVQKGAELLKHVEPGDFVISMRSFQGGIEYCPHEGCVSSAYVPLLPIKWVNSDYFRYLFKSVSYIQALQSTSNLVRDGQALRFENFSLVRLPVIPLEEQYSIAVFLDAETTRIDQMILRQQRMGELLLERRKALISAAVTGKIDLHGWVAPTRETFV